MHGDGVACESIENTDDEEKLEKDGKPQNTDGAMATSGGSYYLSDEGYKPTKLGT